MEVLFQMLNGVQSQVREVPGGQNFRRHSLSRVCVVLRASTFLHY